MLGAVVVYTLAAALVGLPWLRVATAPAPLVVERVKIAATATALLIGLYWLGSLLAALGVSPEAGNPGLF